MTNLKLCSQCGESFKGKAHRKYCSTKCYHDYRESKRIYRNCFECDKIITRSPTHFERVEKPFCSRTCRNKHMTNENHHAYIPKKDCVTCGKKLTRTDTDHCSEECVVRKGSKNPKYLKRNKVCCSQCSKIILRTETFTNETNFCSKDCQNTYHSNRMIGENNPRYKNGVWKDSKRVKSSYTGFTLKIKKAVRARDGNKCQVCDMTKDDHGMNMHVHHIDYVKENNSLENLICVCRYCHGIIHGDEEKWLKILLRK